MRPSRTVGRGPSRSTRCLRSLVAGVLLAGSAGVAAAVEPATDYTVAVLPRVPAGGFFPSSSGNPVNSAGVVAGLVSPGPGPFHAALYDTQRSTARLLDERGGTFSQAQDVDVHGDAVGTIHLDDLEVLDGRARAFFFRARTGQVRFLGPRGRDRVQTAVALNDRGVVVGSGYRDGVLGSPSRALVWYPHGRSSRRLELGRRLGLADSSSVDVTNSGAVLVAAREDGVERGLLWLPWKRVALPVTPLPGDQSVRVSGLNDSGTVVGLSYPRGLPGAGRPFVWDATTRVTRELAPVEGALSQPRAVNAAGTVVGDTASSLGEDRVVLWRADGTVQALPWLASRTGGVLGINRLGQAVGWIGEQTTTWRPTPR